MVHSFPNFFLPSLSITDVRVGSRFGPVPKFRIWNRFQNWNRGTSKLEPRSDWGAHLCSIFLLYYRLYLFTLTCVFNLLTITFVGKLYQNGRNPARRGFVLRGGTVIRAREGVYQRGLPEKTLQEGVSAADVLFGELMSGHWPPKENILIQFGKVRLRSYQPISVITN